MKILVADDDDSCRQLLQDMFAADPSVEFSMTHNGAEAWWKLTEPGSRFDLAIFDLCMPHVDGLQLIERVRTSSAYRNLPIILCTGVNDRDTVTRAVKLSLQHYMVKPYKPAAMREKIETVISRGKSRFAGLKIWS